MGFLNRGILTFGVGKDVGAVIGEGQDFDGGGASAGSHALTRKVAGGPPASDCNGSLLAREAGIEFTDEHRMPNVCLESCAAAHLLRQCGTYENGPAAFPDARSTTYTSATPNPMILSFGSASGNTTSFQLCSQ